MPYQILTNQDFKIINVLTFRKKINQQTAMCITQQIDSILLQNGAQKTGNTVSITHGISVENGQQIIDLEMMIPLDRKINAPDGFDFMPEFSLTNALQMRIEGNPQQLQTAIQKFAEYIRNKNFKPSTPLYVVAVKESTGPLDVDDMITDLYSGVESL